MQSSRMPMYELKAQANLAKQLFPAVRQSLQTASEIGYSDS